MHDIKFLEDIKKANIIITTVKLQPDTKELFIEWQSKLQSVIAKSPGFLSLEIHAPSREITSWTIIQRFSDDVSAKAWKISSEQKDLFDELQSIYENIEERYSGEKTLGGVTEVIITEIAPEMKDFYRQWLSKIHQAEAKVPGFRAVYVQAPIKQQGRYWITFLQFDTAENLDRWLTSNERQEILKELNPLIKAFESHRVISPYAGWFGSIANIGAFPPVWKQTMLVLLVLFPIVMLELMYLMPLIESLNLSVATFLGNAISVALISWPLMPIAIFFFRWWLTPEVPDSRKINFLGALILLGVYLLEVVIFYYFFEA